MKAKKIKNWLITGLVSTHVISLHNRFTELKVSNGYNCYYLHKNCGRLEWDKAPTRYIAKIAEKIGAETLIDIEDLTT